MGLRESDRQILGFLYNSGEKIIANPGTIIRNIDFATATVHERVLVLRDVGLIEYATEQQDGYYQLTEMGDRVVENDLSDQEIVELEQRLAAES